MRPAWLLPLLLLPASTRAGDDAPPPTLHYVLTVARAQPLELAVSVAARGFEDVRWVPGLDAANRFTSRLKTGTQDGAATASYVLDVDGLARRHSNPDVATRVEGGIIIHDGALLFRPEDCDTKTQVRLELSGVDVHGPYTPDGKAFTLDGEQLDGGAYLLLGTGQRLPVEVPGSVVEASLVGPKTRASARALTAWVARSAQLVATFNGGKMPFARTHLILVPIAGNSDSGVFGTTLRWGHGSIVLYLGADAEDAAFTGDWVAPHELFHLSNPYLWRRIPWFTEGFTTYFGDVIRARGGTRTPTDMWDNILSGFEHACDSQSLAGLRTASGQMRVLHNYLRVYWGGACAAFVMDVALRSHTNNAQTLDSWYLALRKRSVEDGPLTEDEIVTAFHAPFPKGHWAHAWVDAALDRRGSMDMPQLYKRLGILRDGEDIKLLDAAPWANVRRAIMGEPPTGNPKVPASIPGPP